MGVCGLGVLPGSVGSKTFGILRYGGRGGVLAGGGSKQKGLKIMCELGLLSRFLE